MSERVEVCPQCWTENPIELFQCQVCGRYMRTLEEQQAIMEEGLGRPLGVKMTPHEESIPTQDNPNPLPARRAEPPKPKRKSIVKELFRSDETDGEAPTPTLHFINQGIPIRLSAFLIDLLLIGILTFMVPLWVGKATGYSMPWLEQGIAGLAIAAIYNILFTRSAYQGTLGQTMCQLVVVDQAGRRISAIRAAIRFVLFLLSLVSILGVLWIGLTKSKRGWHDLLTGTRVAEKVWMIEDQNGHFVPYESKKRHWFSVLR